MPLLLSEQAAFSKHLFVQGYPLWTPSPDLLPPDRQIDGLKIGDVGVVDNQGRFDLFFNTHEPSQESTSSPPILPSIDINDLRCKGGDLEPRRVVSSPATSWRIRQSDIRITADVTRTATEYRTTLSNDGAHIILPQGAQYFELSPDHQRLFTKHALENAAALLQRYNNRLGASESSSIYILTGFYRASAWSVASFGMQGAADPNPVNVCCTIKEENKQTMREHSSWDPTGRFEYKIGPPVHRQAENNQTIFVRGITITPNLSEQGQSERRKSGLLSWLLPSSWSINSSTGSSNKARATERPKGNIIIQRVPQTVPPLHPSEIVNRYLFTKKPSAKFAVTHDSQWIEMLKSLEEGQSWTLEDLAKHVETLVPSHYSIVTHNDTVYLRGREDGSPAHVDVD